MLLDTHVLLWREQDDPRLGAQSREILEIALLENEAAVSSISFWEIGMRIQKGQIEFPYNLDDWRKDLLEQGLVEISVDGAIAIRAGLLQNMRGDPADRIIVATALGGHQLMTADRHILALPGDLLTLDARR